VRTHDDSLCFGDRWLAAATDERITAAVARILDAHREFTSIYGVPPPEAPSREAPAL